MAKQGSENCWEFNDCPEEIKKNCPAFPSNGKKCWEVASSPHLGGCSKAKGRGLLFCVQGCAWFKEMNPVRG